MALGNFYKNIVNSKSREESVRTIFVRAQVGIQIVRPVLGQDVFERSK
jgi:hypothetical protein